jgi:eukaryotic-like serine/threonine-protein kinase
MFKHGLVIIFMAILLSGCLETSVPINTEIVPSTTVVMPADTPIPPTSTPLPPTLTSLSPTTTSIPPTNTPIYPTLPSDPSKIPLAGSTSIRKADHMAMVYIPAGEFIMGSSNNEPGSQANEKPQHNVYLDAYWMDQTEVTGSQFRKFVEANDYQTTAEFKGQAFAFVESKGEWQLVDGANWMHPFGPDSNATNNHPVVQVSWQDASSYCEWVGGSLPSEQQWEKAARGTDGRIYPWGDTFDGTKLNYCDSLCGGDQTFTDGFKYTSPVGSYPSGASPYGIYDMAGNVWEWTADWYKGSYAGKLSAQDAANPSRVLRGGSWNHDKGGMRTAYRLLAPSVTVVDNFGFRCVVQAEID